MTLAVPIDLDALVVNQGVLARDGFRWWKFNYLSLSHFKSPEPMALDRGVGGQQAGVYLNWTLPDALRHAPAGGDYPLVPNRWLVVRANGTQQRQLTAWVLESDCPLTSAVSGVDSSLTSMYLPEPKVIQTWRSSPDPVRAATTLDPAATTVQMASLGVPFPLAQWGERAPTPMFLTAVAPSNPQFAAYVAHNLGVFSFYDPVTGIDQDTLSYFVLGWYSDPTQDPLAGATDATTFAALLDDLGWAYDGAATQTSAYHGSAFEVAWSRTGPPPADDPLQAIRDSGKLGVGVGNTTIDAFTALVGPQLPDPSKAELLRAFQYDFLQQLNQPNGEALLDQQIRQAWFGSAPGGYTWTIVGDTADGTPVPLTAGEQQWLQALNAAQAELDAALSRLYSLQWDVHALWLRRGFLADSANTFPTPPAGVGNLTAFRQRLATALDPGTQGSPAQQLVAQFATVQPLLGQVPQPDWTGATTAQEALQNGIAAFARAKGLDSGKTLKAKAAPRYWQAGNPTVVLSGVDAPTSQLAAGPLPVRSTDALVTGFTVTGRTVDATTVSGSVGTLGSLSAVPGAVGPLLEEFLLLDPASTPMIAAETGLIASAVSAVMTAHDPAAYTGPLPAKGLGAWQQPWTPMYLEWAGTYQPVPFSVGDTPTWAFDGTEYRLAAAPSTLGTAQRSVGGISLLSPHPSYVFGARLDKFVQQFGSAGDLAKIDAWIEQVYGWSFLAQELTGFNDLLALRDTRAFRRPTPADQLGGYPLPALTGYGDGVVPASLQLPDSSLGQVNSVPLFPNGQPPAFHGTREGAFFFTDFLLYDKFGRQLTVIASGTSTGLFDYRNFPVQIDGALEPDQTLVPNVASVLQLPPRLLQRARLDLRLLDATDDTKVYEVDPGVDPISGWVLPNHLDGSISLFAPDGTALGELRLLAQGDGTKVATWQPPPHSDVTLDRIATVAPHLHAMIGSSALAAEASFTAFLAAIDTTLWTVDPLGDRADQNLSVLVGRPLALLRTRLQFQLDGDPITDTGWAATFDPPTPDFLADRFAIRLGDQATRQDGVIGYFTEDDYDTFNAVATPAAGQTYVQAIGPGNFLDLSFAAGTYRYVTVLADPRAAVHATTGILPVKRLDVPQDHVAAALDAMEISFQLGPVLTSVVPAPQQGATAPPYPTAIGFPIPTEQHGSWSWWEQSAGTWTGRGLVPATPDATATTTPSTLREGYLQLTTDLDQQGTP